MPIAELLVTIGQWLAREAGELADRRVVTVGNEFQADGVEARSRFGQWVTWGGWPTIENAVAFAPGQLIN